jgi:crossover junction endodeoxyribonuclease RuvC
VSPTDPLVLGVDPGSLRAGWAVLGGSADRPRLVACGEIRLPADLSFHAATERVVGAHAPAEAAVEAPFHGISARSALQLAHARGVVLAVLGASGIPVTEYAPASIKKAVTGSGRADKGQVQAMISRLVPGAGATHGPDVFDAIATALCHLACARARDRIAEASPSRARR